MHKKSIAKGIVIGTIIGIMGMVAIIFVSSHIGSLNGEINKLNKNYPIIYADDYSRDIIVNALEQINKNESINATDYITDIHIVGNISDAPCSPLETPGSYVLGCEMSAKNLFGLRNASIYILDRNNSEYSDVCIIFEHVVYHEIGHILYQIKYGLPDQQDDIYQKSIEVYADGIGHKYVKFDKSKKSGCKEYFYAQAVAVANKTLNLARQDMEDAKVKLEADKEEVDRDNSNLLTDTSNVNLYNDKVAVDNSNVNLYNGKVMADNKELSTWDVLRRTLDKQGYNNAVETLSVDTQSYNVAVEVLSADIQSYNNAINEYNGARGILENAVNRYKFDGLAYNDAVDYYNSKLGEYNNIVVMANVGTDME